MRDAVKFRQLLGVVAAGFLALFVLLVQPGQAQQADKVVRSNFSGAFVDLVPFLGAVESATPKVTVKVPSAEPGTSATMTLTATSSASATHRWALFTTANPSAAPVELVIDASRQSFPGSGILRPSHLSSRIADASSSSGTKPRRLQVWDRDAFVFTVPARGSVTVALELSKLGVSGIRMWQRDRFDSNTSRQSLFRGVVIGMAALAVLVISCLVVLSPQIVFPLSAIFAWAALGFILLEIGVLERAAVRVWSGFSEEVLSAVIEALMTAGVLLMGVTVMRTRRQLPAMSALFMAGGGICIGLAGYALYEPVFVKQIVRPAFALAVAAVLVTAVLLVSRGGVRARSSLLVWVLLGAWCIAAGYIAVTRPPDEFTSPLLVGGLAAVLVSLAFVLTYFAFSSVLNPDLDILEAERNTLALAGGEQVVWDYQPGDGSFFVGDQFAGLLGYEPGSLDNTSLPQWLGLVHPADLSAFDAFVEAARTKSGQRFEQQLRLRHADGRHRWYLLKGHSMANAAETGMRLAGLLSDASSERQSQDRILSDAIYDVVTGLPNYALYLDRLNQAVSRAAASGQSKLYVMFVDLDRFRVVNSRLGQEIGDSLLKTMARRIEQLLPEGSSIARMPGDQFAIIHEFALAEEEENDVILLVDRLRRAISKPIRVPPNEIFLTCCMGVAQWEPGITDGSALHQNAEIALFDAKRRGKDKVSFYSTGMQLDLSAQKGLTAEDLQNALQEQRFELHYQPIMRLADRQLAGFEALIRLRATDGSIIEPSSFVPLAEKCGLIADIGGYALSEAARQLGVWQRMFIPDEPVFVSVNISSTQLNGSRLLHLAKTILGREELAPGSLKLELTETMVMENPELSLQMLERLKELGLGLSCDDFGTGYSSLSYLRRLPFDTLKVDRSFLQAGLEDERGFVVLDAIILLAHDLGLRVICEGVETDAQMEHLTTLDCDMVQGFLIGEPIDAQQVLEALGAPTQADEASGRGVAALWHRLSRRKPEPAPQPVPLPVESAPEEDVLAPWSPYDFHPAPWAPRVPKLAPPPEPEPEPAPQEPDPVYMPETPPLSNLPGEPATEDKPEEEASALLEAPATEEPVEPEQPEQTDAVPAEPVEDTPSDAEPVAPAAEPGAIGAQEPATDKGPETSDKPSGEDAAEQSQPAEQEHKPATKSAASARKTPAKTTASKKKPAAKSTTNTPAKTAAKKRPAKKRRRRSKKTTATKAAR